MEGTQAEKVISFYLKNRRLPSYQEILGLTGWRSKNSAYKLIRKMENQGWVKKDASGRLVPDRIFGSTRILGYVEAGFPSPAEEELIDTITLDEYLIRRKEATFMLKVSGDSMVEAGIRPGDLVLVERHRTPADGDIVVAEVDGQWTMKFFKKKGGQVFLLPANRKYRPIVPQGELKIEAVVISLIRKYK